MEAKNLLLFGDQTTSILPSVKDIYESARSSPSLQKLLEKSEDAVVSEISAIPLSSRGGFHKYQSMLRLAEEYTESKQFDASVSTVLSCFVQMAYLLIHTEVNSCETYRVVIGTCTGLIVGAVAAVTPSATEILHITPEITRLALRLGLAIDRRSMQMEHCRDSWARAVSGIAIGDIEKSFADFFQASNLHPQRRPYISAVIDPTTTTISGPPSVLKRLWQTSHILKTAPYVELPIAAGFHAGHLDAIGIDELIDDNSSFKEILVKNGELLSPSMGAPYRAHSLDQLLRCAVHDIAQEIIDWETILEQLTIDKLGPQLTLNSIGPNNQAKKLVKRLESSNIKVVQGCQYHTLQGNGSERAGSGDIAIVGMSGRFPGAGSLDEFWQILVDGLDMHREIPASRFDLKSNFDPTGSQKNTTMTPYGCFIEQPGVFDTRLFSLSPREAAQTDPGQRLMLLTTYEALEMAGYTPNGTPSTETSRIGTFFGQTTDDWRQHNASQDIDIYYATGGIRAFGPGRLNYHFKWEGPSYSVDTACSSSSVAIQLACQSLLARETDMAVAGGANILTGCDMYAGLGKGGFLSPTGTCKTFDESADGYCRAEGVGTIVLKRAEDALRDRDNIQAIIRSVSTNHSAQAVSITHPHADTQRKLFQKVLMDAAVQPHQVDYIEAHGTGTQAGDATEFESASMVFGHDLKRVKPLHIGSVKANVGHGEAAAGVESLIKAALMFRNNVIPPHVGIKTAVNPKLSALGNHNLKIALKPTDFGVARADAQQKRTILLNNFSAAGGNTSIVLQDGSPTLREGVDPRTSHCITVSGKTDFSFRRNLQQLSKWLNENEYIQLPDLSYTTTARRMHGSRRISFAVRSIDQLKLELAREVAPFVPKDNGIVAFAFTGQGGRFPGAIVRDLLGTSAYFRDLINQMDRICLSHCLPSILETCTIDPMSLSPVQSQLGTVCLDLALAKLWQSWGLQPAFVVGHSLGEYAALCFASVISISDMIFLVGRRALLMQEKCTVSSHAMLSIGASSEKISEAISTTRSDCEVACLNGRNSTVVSGTVSSVAQLNRYFEDQGIKSTVLPVPYAFHSQQMDDIVVGLRDVAETVDFKKPEIPVVSTLTGKVVDDMGTFSPQYLAEQARQPVNFVGAIEAISLTYPETLWVECGPGSGCASIIRSILGPSNGTALASLKQKEDIWTTISNTLAKLHDAGATINWREFHKPFEKSLLLLELPTYAFDLKDYWIQNEGTVSVTTSTTPATNTVEQVAFISSCLHRVVSKTLDEFGNILTVTFTSDLAEPALNSMAKGHMISGVALVPSSVYAEMAYSAASYIYSSNSQSKMPAFDLSDVEIFQPLIAPNDASSKLVTVSASRKTGSGDIGMTFMSDGHRGPSIHHATCVVKIGSSETWTGEWSHFSSLAEDRIDYLQQLATTGETHVILNKMVYRLFRSVVSYDEKYHSLHKVWLHQSRFEAAANIVFRTTPKDGETYSPYWIDCLAQIGGFALNAGPLTAENTVYISTGWDSLRIAEKLESGKTYRSYVHMKPSRSDGGLFSGEVYLFDGSQPVGMCRGLRFREMKLPVLRAVLGIEQTGVSRSPISRKAPTKDLGLGPSAAGDPQIRSSGFEFTAIVDIISKEVGIEASEITDDVSLEDIGVDSLLTMSILPQLRILTGFDLSSSLFSTYATIGALRQFLESQQPVSSPASRTTASFSSTSDILTPSTGNSSVSLLDYNSILHTITAELGMDVADVDLNTDLAELGIDSLMSISIIGSLREKTGMPIASSFFNDHTTLHAACEAFCDATSTQKPVESVFSESSSSSPPPHTSATSKGKDSGKDAINSPSYVVKSGSTATNTAALEVSELKSKAILLQGAPSLSEDFLFLLPDGSGSALSYINLPDLPSKPTVYALSSPFLSPDSQTCQPFTLSLPSIACLYVNEILRLKPIGPYHVAGWSMGGIYAYEVCFQLLALGHTVKTLLLIDSPCPGFLPPLPAATLEILEPTGIFGGSKKKGISAGTRQHFVESVRTLSSYVPEPLPPATLSAHPRNVAVIWAQDGCGSSPSTPSSENASSEGVDKARDWLMNKREDFGSNGWEKLFVNSSKTSLQTYAVPGNHFSIMDVTEIRAVAQIIATLV